MATICYIAPKIGCSPETSGIWIRQQQPVDDAQDALTTSERQCLKEPERENQELRRSNDILRQASAYFSQAELVYGLLLFAN